MKLYFIFVSLLFFCPNITISAQQIESVTGKVTEKSSNRINTPLIGANIYWAGTSLGTVSSTDGTFSITRTDKTNVLVVSFAGYRSDTLDTSEKNFFEITLSESIDIEQVEITRRWKTTSFSLLDPMKVEKIGEGELQKAACCNLSESFETNASVDVSFTDAITGTKQIQMLGLAGPYSQITRENIPDIRGLSAIYGMEYIPGTWIESIQLNKGTGSVVNGFESMAGQINVELRKPETADRLYFNMYSNDESRVEANLNLSQKLNDKLSTGLLLHTRTQKIERDKNNDKFMDKPVGDQIILLNRWKLNAHKGWESQLGVKTTFNKNQGGQIGYSGNETTGLWGMDMETQRHEGWLKVGRVFQKNPTQSIGMQFSGLNHNQESSFGLKSYSGVQNSVYGNIIFQSQQNVYFKYKLGASLQHDYYREHLDSMRFDRNETVPGVFTEINFSPNDKIDLVAGLRSDYHTVYGLFITPRIHARYAFAEKSVLRFSIGRGQRTASIIAENNSILASSRQIRIVESDPEKPYGLDEEVAWNFGTNFTQKFTLDYRDGTFTVDLYHTRFKNQVVVDLDNSARTVLFYNLDGKSYSNSMQAQVDYELFRRFDLRLAYRWYNIQTTYLSGLKEKPLVSPHRAFMNMAYGTRNNWKFDYTVQWYGSKRIPSTAMNPIEYQLKDYSPQFFHMNAQISKQWWEKFDVYLGVENILDFKQDNPILAAEDPFGSFFDASLTWGPIYGRMWYAGIRFRLI